MLLLKRALKIVDDADKRFSTMLDSFEALLESNNDLRRVIDDNQRKINDMVMQNDVLKSILPLNAPAVPSEQDRRNQIREVLKNSGMMKHTRYCKDWTRFGTCRDFGNCEFAHDAVELRPLVCLNFHCGYCFYDSSCTMRH